MTSAQDPSRMLDLITGLPRMVAEAWALRADPPVPSMRPTAVVTLGLGGSGIGGDLLRSVLADEAPFPVVGAKDYRVPAFLGKNTLALACSYSGATEETLTAYEDASSAGASCVVITSGGELLERARRRGHPAVVVPKGLPPRAALAYLFIPMLAVLHSAGALRSFESEVREAERLEAGRHGSVAEALAGRLIGKIPVIYSATPFLEPVAQRWKDQFNENAKTFAVWNTFPELNHNETVGWGLDASLARTIHVIVLHDRAQPARLSQRVAITKEIAFHRAGGLDEFTSEGEHKLTRLLSLILLGDLVSWNLAIKRSIDPTPVAVIDQLKSRLAAQRAPG
ncbi:MAG TPA: bifunctional phosphoglucose/phosphomannose isomerase [bacterium]